MLLWDKFDLKKYFNLISLLKQITKAFEVTLDHKFNFVETKSKDVKFR